MKEIIQIRHLTYKNILNDVCLTLYKNTINCISGSNNCGKKTLIDILNGNIPVSDMVFYEDKEISQIPFYTFNLMVGKVTSIDDFHMRTVRQEILYRLDKLDLDEREYQNRYRVIVSFFKFRKILSSSIEELTKMEKLKLLIGLELLKKPKILLLDHVFTYFTKNEIEEVMTLLKRIGNITIVIVECNLNCALYCDHLHLFHKGKLILSGKTYEVLQKDSMINKIGLELPFMFDLSLKLQYYNLVDNLELDMNRMIDILWK